MSEAYDRVVHALEEHDCKRDREFCCPAHEDNNPSLSVNEGEDGKVLITCHVGCRIEDIVEALGLTMQDLFVRGTSASPGTKREMIATYDYMDEGGELLFQVCRYRPKDFRQRRPKENGGWHWNLKGTRRVLYRLPQVVRNAESVVYIVEGEKDADRLAAEGLVATTSPSGAGKWSAEYNKALRDRDVVILPDNDDPGRKHACAIAQSLQSTAWSVKVVALPDLPHKGDVSDWFEAGGTVEELKSLVQAAEVWRCEDTPTALEPAAENDSEKQRSQATRLVERVISADLELFHDDLGGAFVRVPVGDHHEIWSCRSRDFKNWLAQLHWQSESKVPGSEALTGSLNVLEAMARFEGKEYTLHNRVTFDGDAIWYDLADRHCRAVRVTANGWTIADPPILFRRYAHQQPQPEPIPGGDLHDLLRFVNLSDPTHEVLLLVYIVCCFVPDIPHPIPVIHGPAGAAKTTLFRMLRRLIDPSAVEVLSFPHNMLELVQQLSHHWAPFYDNITRLSEGTSDVLCRAVTGEGGSKRGLFTNDEDVLYTFRRCVGLNGINVAAYKPDLLDRCILFGLERIAPTERKPEKTLWREFDKIHPALLGAIFDVLSRAMALRQTVHLCALPRMADFALWGCAVARAMGYADEEFLGAYRSNADARNEEALQASPVAAMVQELTCEWPEWEGSPSELLAELDRLAEEHHVNQRAPAWPKAPNVLSRRINEVSHNLAEAGIEVTARRDGSRRIIMIRKKAGNTVTTVTSATSSATDCNTSPSQAFPCDDTCRDDDVPSPVSSPRTRPMGPAGDRCDGDDGSDGISQALSVEPNLSGRVIPGRSANEPQNT